MLIIILQSDNTIRTFTVLKNMWIITSFFYLDKNSDVYSFKSVVHSNRKKRSAEPLVSLFI
ncbi:hypothetical protein JWG44_00210 [Leptospira sp. 201903071]|uniref:hypothetical protein n=1 Tax=Leptospira ainazelensis TaxID=2810034 RepID=UPI0019643A44|nr:hypothetical protein [Leptospira ainazelensis]MBM9498676.1 hypothetical protein [Leptospira ainazelensis]